MATRLAPPDTEAVERARRDRSIAVEWRHDVRWAVLAIALALVPVLCVLAFRAGSHYVPLGDEAIIDMRVRDVFTSHSPLVGVYSRGFNHPGPILYWLLAPLSAITGHQPWAIMVGGALLQGVAIALCGWLAFRRAGLLLCLGVLAALGLAYSSFAFGSQFLQAWNPNIAFPFFMLFLLQAWSLATGSRWQLLGVVVTGTLLVQLHVGYLPLVAVAAGWAIAVVVIERRRGSSPPVGSSQAPWRRVVTWSIVAAALLWVVVVVQQLVQTPGNLGQLYAYFRHAGAVAGLHRGAGLFAAEFRFPPPWLGGHDHVDVFTDEVVGASLVWLLVPIALLGIGFFATHRSRRRADRRMLELATVNALATIVAMSRISVELQAFVFYWRVVSAVFVVLAACWAIAGWLRLDQHRVRSPAAVALVVVIATFFGVRARDDVVDDGIYGPAVANVDHLLAEVHAAGLPHDPVLLRGIGRTTDGLAQALFDDLDRSDVPVRVDSRWGYQYGAQRTAGTEDVHEVWFVGSSGSGLALLDQHPGGRLVAEVTPLSADDERELRGLQRTLWSRLVDAGRADLVSALDSSLVGFVMARARVPGIDPARVQRLVELNQQVDRGTCRCFVISYPPSQAPTMPTSMGY